MVEEATWSRTSANADSTATPRSRQHRQTRSNVSPCWARTRWESLRSISSASRAARRAASEAAGPSRLACVRLRAWRSFPTATIVLAWAEERSPIRPSSALRALRRARSATSWTMLCGDGGKGVCVCVRVSGRPSGQQAERRAGLCRRAAHQQLVDFHDHHGAPPQVRHGQAAALRPRGRGRSLGRGPALARRLPLLRFHLLEARGSGINNLHVLARDSHIARRRLGPAAGGGRRRRAARRACPIARSHSASGRGGELGVPLRCHPCGAVDRGDRAVPVAQRVNGLPRLSSSARRDSLVALRGTRISQYCCVCRQIGPTKRRVGRNGVQGEQFPAGAAGGAHDGVGNQTRPCNGRASL